MEFGYAKETASQAINDRYTMLNYYIGIVTAVGSISAGLISTQKGNNVFVASAGLLLITAIVGWVFLAIMLRLRQAWLSSLQTMNEVKSAYITSDSDLAPALRWSNQTLPKAYKPWSIHYFSSLLIVALNSLCLALAFGLYLFSINRRGMSVAISLGLFLFSTVLQLYIYRRVLAGNAS